MAKNALLKPENFKSTEYAVVFFNLFSQTQTSGARTVQFAELGDDWMSLKVPRTSCNRDHHLMVHILPLSDVAKLGRNALKKTVPGAISITAVVKEVKQLTQEFNLVTLHFLQYNEPDWKDFLAKRGSIQKEVDVLMKRIKG